MRIAKSKITKQNIFSSLILFFSIFPLLPNKIKGLPIILLLISSFFFFDKKKIEWKWFFINNSLYILFLLSLMIGDSIGKNALNNLETCLSILVIPLIFHVFNPNFRINRELFFTFLKGFILSSSLFALIIFLYVFLDENTFYYDNWYTNKARTLIEKIPLINQHPIYASIFSAVGIIFGLELYRQRKNKSILETNMIYGSILINSLFLLFILSKGVIISLFIVLIIFVFFQFKSTKKRFIFLTILILSVLSLFLFNRRMKELFTIETYTQINTNYSNGIRIKAYQCSLKLAEEKLLLGYGVGNSQTALNNCYKNIDDTLLLRQYNSHNQYLDILLKTGIIGLIVFISFLIFNFRKAVKFRNELLILLIIFFCINFITENILLRQSGVILFYLILIVFSKIRMNKNI